MRDIQPLGEQIIIKTMPLESLGSILIPDSAKRHTLTGEKGAEDAVHYVEAEVVAVGPGKRQKGDRSLIPDMAYTLQQWRACSSALEYGDLCRMTDRLLARAENVAGVLPMMVKPGDRILYHPAVQKFDRDITHLMQNGEPSSTGVKWFMIREDSVLAVIEP